MSDTSHVQVERDGPVARLWLDRPPLNILDIPLMGELYAALEALPGPPHLRFLVFAGRGERGFSAGVDVFDHTPDRVAEMLGRFHRIFRKLWNSDWITIAAVHGYCLGGGMELATFCDFLLATHTARFAQPEIKLGCFPPVAAAVLPALVGPRRALDLILTGRTLTAGDARNLGCRI
jgi:cyclohexa-1,5-dienecarbonyl-CoA hydratase